MEFLNIGMQSVGRHKYEFIFVHYATFSYQIAPETLLGHTPGLGVVVMHLLYCTLYIIMRDNILR